MGTTAKLQLKFTVNTFLIRSYARQGVSVVRVIGYLSELLLFAITFWRQMKANNGRGAVWSLLKSQATLQDLSISNDHPPILLA